MFAIKRNYLVLLSFMLACTPAPAHDAARPTFESTHLDSTYGTSNGNLLSSKGLCDFATQVGPTITYTYDATKLKVTSVTRSGDKNGDEQKVPGLIFD